MLDCGMGGVELIIYLIIGGVLINNYTWLLDGCQVITFICGGLPNNLNLIIGGVTKWLCLIIGDGVF